MCIVSSEDRAQSALRAVAQFANVAGQVQHEELRTASLQVAHEALAQCEAHGQRCVQFLLEALQKSTKASASAAEDVIWMVYKVARRSDTAKAYRYALEGLRSLAELLEGCRGTSAEEVAVRGAICGALYHLVSPRRKSTSALAAAEVVQPESVVVLLSEVLSIGGLDEDALWATCTTLETLVDKDARLAFVVASRGAFSSQACSKAWCRVSRPEAADGLSMDQIIRDLVLLPVSAASDLVTKGWYTSNFRQIRELVQDPDYQSGEVDPDEPVLEVVVGDANMKATASATPTFVRIFMDRENVGETSLQKKRPFNTPVWNERFLLLPRASFSTRFEVVDTWDRVLGHCTIGTQSLWRAAEHSGQVSVELPLQQGKGLNGKIWVHSRPWDGLPLPERPWWPRAQELHEDTWSPLRMQEGTEEDVVGSLQPEDTGKSRAKVLSSDLFSRIDKDRTGSITRAEFEAALRSGAMSPQSPAPQTQVAQSPSIIWPQPVKPSAQISAPQISMPMSPQAQSPSGVLSQFAATVPPQPVVSPSSTPLVQFAQSMPPQPVKPEAGQASPGSSKDFFAKIDKDGSGSITRAEFERAIRQGELQSQHSMGRGQESLSLPIGKSCSLGVNAGRRRAPRWLRHSDLRRRRSRPCFRAPGRRRPTPSPRPPSSSSLPWPPCHHVSRQRASTFDANKVGACLLALGCHILVQLLRSPRAAGPTGQDIRKVLACLMLALADASPEAVQALQAAGACPALAQEGLQGDGADAEAAMWALGAIGGLKDVLQAMRHCGPGKPSVLSGGAHAVAEHCPHRIVSEASLAGPLQHWHGQCG
ncbi:unnamed protein product [Symbiodinium sp. KB8]|nr:unnamed protein product [Symbiodinium sp. KB8]